MENEKKISSDLIIPKLTVEQKKKKIENEERVRSRRDEDMESILISEVPREIQEQEYEIIRQFAKTSKAQETFNRLEKESFLRKIGKIAWGNDPTDDRETYQNDWWKHPALLSAAEKSLKEENKRKRREGIKNLFYICSGLKFIADFNRDRKKSKEDKDMVQQFLDENSEEQFIDSRSNPLSQNLYDFTIFLIKYKKWRLVMRAQAINDIIFDFKKQKSLKDDDLISKDILLDFYKYFREN